MDWYYVKQGERMGPLPLATMQQYVREGRLGPGDLVWCESFGQAWQPLSNVPELQTQLVSAAPLPRAGTGGQTPNAELMARAREALAGQWGLSIGIMLVYMLVMWGVQMVFMVFPPLIIGMYFIMPPLVVGLSKAFLNLSRRREATVGQIFEGFQCYGTSLGVFFLTLLYMMLWSLLIMIPAGILGGLGFWVYGNSGQAVVPILIVFGVIAYVLLLIGIVWIQLRYAQVYFMAADDPSVGAVQIVKNSVEVMKGRKWKLVCLWLRFFGWYLLCLLTCGIGFLWLMPYVMTSFALFYRDLLPGDDQATAVG